MVSPLKSQPQTRDAKASSSCSRRAMLKQLQVELASGSSLVSLCFDSPDVLFHYLFPLLLIPSISYSLLDAPAIPCTQSPKHSNTVLFHFNILLVTLSRNQKREKCLLFFINKVDLETTVGLLHFFILEREITVFCAFGNHQSFYTTCQPTTKLEPFRWF